MFEIEQYIRPLSFDEALYILQNEPNPVVLGGCGYLKLANRKIGTAIDLSALDLDYIEENDGFLEIGAMTTLRTIEIHPLTKSMYSGLLPKSVENIVGVQLRNGVTIGGSVAGRYAFSDPICALLALDAELEFLKEKRVKLSDYLKGGSKRDILLKIVLPVRKIYAAYQSVRRNATDYPMLNCAVTKNGGQFRIVVGSRPAKAALAESASEFLSDTGLTSDSIKKAAALAADKMNFGDNPRASKAYRQAVCPALVKRALTEIAEEVEDAA